MCPANIGCELKTIVHQICIKTPAPMCFYVSPHTGSVSTSVQSLTSSPSRLPTLMHHQLPRKATVLSYSFLDWYYIWNLLLYKEIKLLSNYKARLWHMDTVGLHQSVCSLCAAIFNGSYLSAYTVLKQCFTCNKGQMMKCFLLLFIYLFYYCLFIIFSWSWEVSRFRFIISAQELRKLCKEGTKSLRT